MRRRRSPEPTTDYVCRCAEQIVMKQCTLGGQAFVGRMADDGQAHP